MVKLQFLFRNIPHLIHTGGLAEVADVLADFVEQLLLCSLQNVVGPRLLIGSDEVWEVDGGAGLHVLHKGTQLLLQIVVQDCGTLHGVSNVHGGDVPA